MKILFSSNYSLFHRVFALNLEADCLWVYSDPRVKKKLHFPRYTIEKMSENLCHESTSLLEKLKTLHSAYIQVLKRKDTFFISLCSKELKVHRRKVYHRVWNVAFSDYAIKIQAFIFQNHETNSVESCVFNIHRWQNRASMIELSARTEEKVSNWIAVNLDPWEVFSINSRLTRFEFRGYIITNDRWRRRGREDPSVSRCHRGLE